ncbi:hypothetical protein ACTFIR_002053 [Dictyostelium discoideum]
MDIKLEQAKSPPPTNPELMVKSPTYSRTKERRREETSELNHELHMRNVSEKAKLEIERGQENVERERKRMDDELKEKGVEFNYDLEKGQEIHDKYIAGIMNKGKEDVDHSFKVHDEVKKQLRKNFEKRSRSSRKSLINKLSTTLDDDLSDDEMVFGSVKEVSVNFIESIFKTFKIVDLKEEISNTNLINCRFNNNNNPIQSNPII